MKWLQWSTADLRNGLGGVEVHARSLARELAALGHEPTLSSDPRDLERDDWDVVHFHGSATRSILSKRAIRIHTLHGTTAGRMAACREWFWPGGYSAFGREIRGVLAADVVLSVHPELSLLRLARKVGKVSAVCWNGWDSGSERGELSPEIRASLADPRPKWLFVGRGSDPMKGADRIRGALRARPEIHLLAAPGAGFESVSGVFRTGKLDSSQVRELMAHADGLLIPSRYEGHSLVVLESLASGLVVVATPVGAIPVLPVVLGLEVVRSGDPEEILEAMSRAEKKGLFTAEQRAVRRTENQSRLPRWKSVAEIAIRAVEEAKARRP